MELTRRQLLAGVGASRLLDDVLQDRAIDRTIGSGAQVETLYTNGPAAGGGVFKSARDVVAVASVLLPRELARPQVRFVGV